MSNSGYKIARHGPASTDCTSVHSHGSLSAWESIVGHDDPTVPINNCKETQTPEIPDSATIDSFVTQADEHRDVVDSVDASESSSWSSERKGLRDQLSELDKTEKSWQDKALKPENTDDIAISRTDEPEPGNTTMNSIVRTETIQHLEIHSIGENKALDVVSEGRQLPVPDDTSSENSTNSTTTNEIVRQVQKRLSKSDNMKPKRELFDENFRDAREGHDEEMAVISTELGDTKNLCQVFSDEPGESTWKIDLDNLDRVADFEQGDGINRTNGDNIDEDNTIPEKTTWLAAWARSIALALALVLALVVVFSIMISNREEPRDAKGRHYASPLDLEIPAQVSSSQIPTLAPSTMEPTQLPSLPPTRQPSHAPSTSEAVLSQIFEQSGNALLEEGSVQEMAYTWLLEDDRAKGDLSTLESDHVVQRYVCALLYFALNGTNWYSQLNFISTTSVCEWNDGKGKGIYCDGFGNVSRITIYTNNLRGKLPFEIGSLPFLQELRLRDNGIVGQMPTTLSNLHELQLLELSSNDLTGPLPEFSPTQNDLYHLSINDNRISGSIPEAVGSLRGLLYMDIQSNNLTGTLPASLGTLPRLVTIYASKNQLRGPLPKFEENLGLLQAIDISNNQISGQLEHFFSQDGPKRLAEVNFDSNHLTGSIPSSLDSYTSLTSISIAHNEIAGSLVPSFEGMKGLRRLSLDHNLLTGELPRWLAGIASLAELRVDHNQFNGNLDSYFCTSLNAPTLTTFSADCKGPHPEVTCSCCTSCCDASLGCEDM